VKHTELKQLLIEFAAERLALLQRHESGARAVSHYDFNNTYQYVIAREETHLMWLRAALAEDGVSLPAAASPIPVPDTPKSARQDARTHRAVFEDDRQRLASFVERWRPRVADVTHARHRAMLNIILDESLEHQRFFEQAASGMEDLLGRRTTEGARTGVVLSTRWIE